MEVLTTDNQIEVCDIRLTTLGPITEEDKKAAAKEATPVADPAN